VKSVLYLTRNGLLEPLGYSQVLSYLRGLSTQFRVAVVTFEKPRDLKDVARVEAVEAECNALGIRWIRYRFHDVRYVAPAAAMGLLMRHALDGRWGRFDLVHARSHVPAVVAMAANVATGVPYVFDTRGLWVEELVESGLVTPGTPMHRALSVAERRALERAAGVVVLTNAARRFLEERHSFLADKPMAVIPTCVDLDRFFPDDAPQKSGPTTFGCVGTVLSGWFDFPRLRDFIEVARNETPGSAFEIVTQEPNERVRAALGDAAGDVRVRSATPVEMPEIMRRHTVSLVFYKTGTSQIARSPTRLGEALAVGVPVVTNEGVGDVAEIVRRHDVGVVLPSDRGTERLAHAIRRAVTLANAHDIRPRCRAAAEAEFSLETGTRRYAEMYQQILRHKGAAERPLGREAAAKGLLR
jgi:glycosyltransferase involved in cell wall biosynthesis